MRMFNIKNKSAMRYVIKRETTGKVGRREYDHRIIILRDFPTYNDALAAMSERKSLLRGNKFNARVLGPDNDYYAILCSKELDCIERYWIDIERSEPEVPWWREY